MLLLANALRTYTQYIIIYISSVHVYMYDVCACFHTHREISCEQSAASVFCAATLKFCLRLQFQLLRSCDASEQNVAFIKQVESIDYSFPLLLVYSVRIAN